MSEEQFNPDKLRNRLATPLPETIADELAQKEKGIPRLYKDVLKVTVELEKMKKDSERIIDTKDSRGVLLDQNIIANVRSRKTQLIDDINQKLIKTREAVVKFFLPPFNLAKDTSDFVIANKSPEPEPEQDDSSARFMVVEHQDLTAADFVRWEEVLDRADYLLNKFNLFKRELKRSLAGGECKVTVDRAMPPYDKEAIAYSNELMFAYHLGDSETITWDLVEVLKTNQKYFRDMGLDAWAEDIATFDPEDLTDQQLEIMRREISMGALPIIMPSENVQRATTLEDIKDKLKPIYILDGVEQVVNESHAFAMNLSDFINHATGLSSENIPDRPYMAMMSAGQKPAPSTINRRNTSSAALIEINTERAQDGQTIASPTNLFEYLALTAVSTRTQRDSGSSTVTPIDSRSATLLIGSSLADQEKISSIEFDPNRAGLLFGVTDPSDLGTNCGFRITVRVVPEGN